MAMWKKALVLVVASLVVALPVVTQVSVAQTVPAQEAQVVLPQGKELSDTQLQKVDGKVAPLAVVAAAIVYAGFGAASDLMVQGVQIALGQRSKIDWKETGISAGIGAVTGPVLGKVASPLTKVVRTAIVSGARWTARAAAVTGSAAVSRGSRIANGFKTAGYATYNGLKTAGYAIYNSFKSFGRLFGRK